MERYGEEAAKTKYFRKLTTSHLSMMRVLKAGELLRPQSQGIDIWRNVAEHCLAQAAACQTLGEMLELSNESLSNLVSAALVHDWDKKYQSIGLRSINQQLDSREISEEEGGKIKYDFFEESEEHSVNGLKALGISEEIIKIASADGHPALPRMMDPDTSMEERVLHYVGSIVNESKIDSLNKRIDDLENNKRYAMMNEYGREVPWTKGRTLYEVQREVGHNIEKELVDLLMSKDTLPESLINILRQNPEQLPNIISEVLSNRF